MQHTANVAELHLSPTTTSTYTVDVLLLYGSTVMCSQETVQPRSPHKGDTADRAEEWSLAHLDAQVQLEVPLLQEAPRAKATPKRPSVCVRMHSCAMREGSLKVI